MPRPENSAAKPGVNPWVVALTISMATFMEVLDTSIANVSLLHIAGDIGVSQNEATWVLTSYLVSNAIIIPISGWLSLVIGRKRFYMSCVALFTVSSFLCGIAPSLGLLLFFRVLQGAGGGGLQPSEQSMLADTFPKQYFGMAFAIYGLAVVVAPAIGPSLGGFITDNYSWRWIFFLNVPVGLLSLFLTYNLVQDAPFYVEQTKRERAGGLRIDYLGFLLVVVGFGALQLVLDKGQEDDWFGSSFIVFFMLLSLVGLVGMVVRELTIKGRPLIDLKLLANPNLASSMGLMFVVGFILSSTTVLIPQFAQELLGYDATHAGLVLMPGGLVLMLMMPLAGQLVRRVAPKVLMCTGLVILSFALFYMSGFNTTVSFSHLAGARVLMTLGLPLLFVPLNTVAYANLAPGQSENASAMINLMRNLGGSIGISLSATLLVRRAQVHQDHLAASATRFDAPFVEHINDAGGFTQKNIVSFYELVQQQAAMLSYIDVFLVLIFACVVGLGAVLSLGRTRPSAQPELVH